jgi:hypothetical protein
MDTEDYKRFDACSKEKEKHDACFFQWYNEKFLSLAEKGGVIQDDCVAQFNEYRECLVVFY